MKKVLVADDTKNIRLLLMKCLQMEGYGVITANDGDTAREILLNEDIDFAFIDIKMPNLSGTEVIRHIRALGIMTPVIVITAYATVKNAVECTQMGAVAYLQKPFTADKIKAVIKECFDEPHGSIPGSDATLKMIRDHIGKGAFSKALQMLSALLPKEATNPEVYMLLSKAYGGLGNVDMEKKFYQTYQIFTGMGTDLTRPIAPGQ